jgi:hypothetical protein
MALTKLRSGGITDDAVVAAALATDSVGADALSSSAILSSDLPSDSILEIVSDHGSSTSTVNSTSYTSIGMEANITPSSTSSLILCLVTGAMQQDDGNGAIATVRLRRDTTEVSSSYAGFDSNDNATTQSYSMIHIDTPNTTSQITYSVQAKTSISSSDFRPKGTGDNLILVEIAG